MAVTYKCFKCGKKIGNSELSQRFVCPKCGNKIFYKPRTVVKTIKAE
jgi:DNA-directed RNA polymerase subunit RPC12/RpoP